MRIVSLSLSLERRAMGERWSSPSAASPRAYRFESKPEETANRQKMRIPGKAACSRKRPPNIRGETNRTSLASRFPSPFSLLLTGWWLFYGCITHSARGLSPNYSIIRTVRHLRARCFLHVCAVYRGVANTVCFFAIVIIFFPSYLRDGRQIGTSAVSIDIFIPGLICVRDNTGEIASLPCNWYHQPVLRGRCLYLTWIFVRFISFLPVSFLARCYHTL